jgi:hypothetical protein
MQQLVLTVSYNRDSPRAMSNFGQYSTYRECVHSDDSLAVDTYNEIMKL